MMMMMMMMRKSLAGDWQLAVVRHMTSSLGTNVCCMRNRQDTANALLDRSPSYSTHLHQKQNVGYKQMEMKNKVRRFNHLTCTENQVK